MGKSYEALNGEAKLAVDWKARENLNAALAAGNEMVINNQKRFLESNKESLANNAEGVRLIIIEYKNVLSGDD